MPINREWHLNNRMPKNTSEEERAKWHKVHSENCNCYPLSESVKKLITKYDGKSKPN